MLIAFVLLGRTVLPATATRLSLLVFVEFAPVRRNG
jgi:hypothetical protein